MANQKLSLVSTLHEIVVWDQGSARKLPRDHGRIVSWPGRSGRLARRRDNLRSGPGRPHNNSRRMSITKFTVRFPDSRGAPSSRNSIKYKIQAADLPVLSGLEDTINFQVGSKLTGIRFESNPGKFPAYRPHSAILPEGLPESCRRLAGFLIYDIGFFANYDYIK